jgi:integral membrane protein
MSPLLFRRVAVAEAFTWAGLLSGMFLKYVTQTTEVGVQVFGMLHGVVFIGYVLVTLAVAVDQQWSRGRTLLGLASAVPPFLTLWFERYAARHDLLADRWRLRTTDPTGLPEQVVALLVRNPARGVVTGALGVVVLTGVALLLGPPAG